MEIVPSASAALAVILMFSPSLKIASALGAVIATLGATLDLAITFTVTASETVDKPPLSVALAVKLYVPTGTLAHVKLNGAEVSVPIKVFPS